MMTLDEAIKHAEEVAEENQRIVDTGIVFDDVTIDMLYCDDTEVIEEHLANYQKCADEHRQLAEWLKDYKRLKEQESTRKKGKWIDTKEISTNRRGQIVHEVICSECNGISYFRGIDSKYIGANLCPNCGAEMESELWI